MATLKREYLGEKDVVVYVENKPEGIEYVIKPTNSSENGLADFFGNIQFDKSKKLKIVHSFYGINQKGIQVIYELFMVKILRGITEITPSDLEIAVCEPTI